MSARDPSLVDAGDLAIMLAEAAETGLALVAIPEARPHAAAPRPLPVLSEGRVAPPPIDKYTIADRPIIDCASLLHLCGARCCHLSVALTSQDIGEGIVRPDPEAPNRNLRRADRSCIHLEERRCTIYDARPAVCRRYDCRKDSRIWVDFEKRIPARSL